tara:strand:+ start:594 stop:956 length:363 start_codon:yes stop_codon:yes gene_type:complete
MLTETEELFLLQLETTPTIKAAAEATGISAQQGYSLSKKLKDTIIERARDNLATAALKASTATIELMDADASTEKGELRLAASKEIMDRVGLTKHTSVEVSIESENGIFILPAKASLEDS